ncbi:AraC family transcriptional regulator [Paenibacillus sp. ClWae2A]|uniref:AraC family transcriptional regulator n=1 Tax=Paenibacillus sp. ClWae2A TaxID=3057177 RepID=UPI0028F6019B|nr:AraC family transcriptional regulator [Paenibacillus sp. ClWae2A]MDT9722779.1 AraC family transcriptional regulator [Paenibacillus sp. ClWae2A]
MNIRTAHRNSPLPPTAFHSYFFRFVDIESVTINTTPKLLPDVSLSYRLIVVSEGSGSIYIDDSCYRAVTGNCYAVSPGAKLVISSSLEEQEVLHYFSVTFDIISALPDERPLPFANSEIIINPFVRTLTVMHKLTALKHPESEDEQLSYHFRFQKWMHTLLKQNTVTVGFETVTSMQAVEQSVSFLKDHFNEEISTKQLAEKTGISIKQYIRLFKHITGVTPHEYISTLRIRKAKELLLVSRQPLAEIAEQVGYRDSYYFNRRFKQITGVPPRVYVNTRQYKIMSMSYVCALLALGIKPIGAPAYHMGYYAGRLGDNITNIGDKSILYYDRMRALKPDLIISCDTIDPETQQQLEHIAPIVTIPWMDLHATEHLQAIGDVLGMEKQAKSWIDDYELKREVAHQRIKNYVSKDETVGLLLIEGSEIYVLGDRNAGEIMYRSFGLQPPPLVQHLLVEHPNQYGRKVEVEQLWQYEADRLFVIVYGAEAATTYKQLQQNPVWEQLSAVRQGKVQTIDSEKWIYYDVLSLSGQLDDGINILAKR